MKTTIATIATIAATPITSGRAASAVDTARVEDHAEVGLSEILSLRVGCWQPPVHVAFTHDTTPHAA